MNDKSVISDGRFVGYTPIHGSIPYRILKYLEDKAELMKCIEIADGMQLDLNSVACPLMKLAGGMFVERSQRRPYRYRITAKGRFFLQDRDK
jgi:predicted transcriptional regulator